MGFAFESAARVTRDSCFHLRERGTFKPQGGEVAVNCDPAVKIGLAVDSLLTFI